MPDSGLFMMASVASLVSFLLGIGLSVVYARRRIDAAYNTGRASREAEFIQLSNDRQVAQHAVGRIEQTLTDMKRELSEARTQLIDLSTEGAKLSGRLERLAQVEAELLSVRTEVVRWREACQRAEQQSTALSTRLHEQQAAMQEKIALLAEAREQLTASFKGLAGEILEEKSKRFTEQNAVNLGHLLNPLREQLGEFRKTVTDVYDKESRERGLLKHEIDTLKNLNQRISEDAVNLTRALKGESKTQGAWGELILERLLEASGLQKGREYEAQVSLRNDEGGRPRPDVIVHLPEGRDLVIDAKVSLTAYERYCVATDKAERDIQLNQHLISLRGHIKDLAERRYSDLPGLNTLEFVLMFVPVEAAYIEAVHGDDTLHQFALERQVVIVTTSTLLATLRTVSSLWRFDDRNRNALEIAAKAGALYDKFCGFVDDLAKVRSGLDGAQKNLGEAFSKLSNGKGNLVRKVEELRKLGAKASKLLPAEHIEQAQDLLAEKMEDNE